MPEPPIRLYRTKSGCVVEQDGQQKLLSALTSTSPSLWDDLAGQDDLVARLSASLRNGASITAFDESEILAPIESQEVWAAGVTYFRSRDARMEESKSAGGGNFYDRVYNAERPELFFKSTASRVVGHGGKVAIRSDAKWSVPEPELALLVNPRGKIVGYTIGNDMSSRDIEGENPLYLPQAKVYHRSCALGPCVLVANDPPAPSTVIRLEILRAGVQAFTGSTTLSAIKRDFATLVHYLYRDNIFPHGCILLTGTGIVPPDAFTLQQGDEIRISIDGIGILVNVVG
jgi:2-dehydro-3-deoxy-D-arabinonate dehydratase